MLRKTPPCKKWRAETRTEKRNEIRAEKSEERKRGTNRNGKVWRAEKRNKRGTEKSEERKRGTKQKRKSLTNGKEECKRRMEKSAPQAKKKNGQLWQSITEYYRVLQSTTEYYKILQSTLSLYKASSKYRCVPQIASPEARKRESTTALYCELVLRARSRLAQSKSFKKKVIESQTVKNFSAGC